ncbi:MAG TPA: D-glycerate dehydrogenase [Ilumatobacter sp.]|nr:D-glycerate dehydrogenase [Ilumatobacter sp.]
MAPRIVVTGRIPEPGLDLLGTVGDVWAWNGDGPVPRDVRDDRLATAEAVVTLLTDRVDDSFLDAAPNLLIVANVAVGYNNIDVDACRRRGIVVTNTPGVLTDATADLAMALVLVVTRRLGEGERLVRSGSPWEWGMFMMLGTGLQGRTLGIVGMGEIGEALAERARAFGMSIVYHNRRQVDTVTEERLGARLVTLDDLLATSDVVSLNCPYTPETHHLIDDAALRCMRPGAFLVNTARGPIVDEEALVHALQEGVIAGAALDVYEHEPVVHPGLLELDNAVLVPHLGSATIETRSAMAELAARNVVEVVSGRAPLTPV